jgi:hypothetical protein
MKHGKPDFTIPEIGTEMFEERYRSWKRLEYKNPNCMPGTINYDYSYLIYQNHLENELFLKNFGVIPIETGEAMVTGKDQHG